jgi:Bifunctional DNA primase/polymerase, N-terminal
MSTLLEAALAYAAAALPVFPLIVGGKIPAVARGFHAASTNPETVKRYWRIADRNIGVPTGIASGFWVVDIDPGGDEEIRRLEASHGRLPTTRTVITPRGGKHLWFKYVGPVPSSVGRIADHIDCRGDLGYVAMVPSRTMDGSYSWLGDPKADLAVAPSWLLDLARKKPKPTISERAVGGINHRGFKCPGDQSAYGRAALDCECAALAATPAGKRNNVLNRASFRLHQLVAGGELHRDEVVERLRDACHRNHLIEDDGLRSVEATIRSGANAGLGYPRSRNGGAS